MIGLGPFGGEVPVALKAMVLVMTVEKAGQEGAALAKVVQAAKAAEALKAAEAAKVVPAAKSVSSRIKESSRLAKETEAAGKSHQESLDRLVEQLQSGNTNPGIGTKPIGSGLSEARAGWRACVLSRNGGED